MIRVRIAVPSSYARIMNQPADKSTKTSSSRDKAQAEQARLAKALKANLLRRKAVKKK